MTTTVDVTYLHLGERYYIARFKSLKHPELLQVYGASYKELEDRVTESLDYEFGKDQYKIQKIDPLNA